MRKEDCFVRNNSTSTDTIESKAAEYTQLNKNIERLEEANKSYYEILGNQKDVKYESEKEAVHALYRLRALYYESDIKGEEFDFKNQHALYYTIEYIEANPEEINYFKNNEIYLEELQQELLEKHEDIRKYVRNCNGIKLNEEKKSRIVENTNLSIVDKKHNHPQCAQEGHYFIKLGNELRCIYCGFSTKDYDLSEEELKFLEDAIRKKGRLLEEATEEDLPLIQVLLQEEQIKQNERKEEKTSSVSELDKQEEDWCTLHYMSAFMRSDVKRAHKMDKREYLSADGDPIYDPKYFDYETIKEKLTEVNKQIAEASEEAKPELKVRRFEILILSGLPIPGIYERIKNEEDKDYFVMAYENLGSMEYRKNCGFIKKTRTIGKSICYDWFYVCSTAHPDINKRLYKKREETIKAQNKENDK